MLSAPTILLYILFGCGVAVALYLTDRHKGYGERTFVVFSALIFWPIYLPIILASRSATTPAFTKSRTAKDEMDTAIDKVDTDLSKAMASLESWEGGPLVDEAQRIDELRRTWPALAERIRELDRLLTESEPVVEAPLTPALNTETVEAGVNERLQRSIELRRQNLDHLRAVRRTAYEDLMGRLALVRELVSMIHVAKYTGAPAERARELVAQIMAAGEGIGRAQIGEAVTNCQDQSQSGS